MGLFKGMKDLKALGDEHGGMPSMKSAFKDIAAVADDRGERDILKSGTPAKAVVKGFPNPVPGDRFALQIPLEIHPSGGQPYEINYTFTAARMRAPLSAGMEVPVKVDPSDPQRVAVQWDAQQASIAAAGGDMAAVQAGLNATYGTPEERMAKAQAEAQAQADPAAKLQKLTEMKDSGLITEDEYATKRAEILAQM